MLSGRQIRAARALLGISANELAKRAGIGWATIQRLEKREGLASAREATILQIRSALEAAGIEFTGDPIHSPGVRLVRNKKS